MLRRAINQEGAGWWPPGRLRMVHIGGGGEGPWVPLLPLEKTCRGHPGEAMEPGVSKSALEGRSTVQKSQAWKSR